MAVFVCAIFIARDAGQLAVVVFVIGVRKAVLAPHDAQLFEAQTDLFFRQIRRHEAVPHCQADTEQGELDRPNPQGQRVCPGDRKLC